MDKTGELIIGAISDGPEKISDLKNQIRTRDYPLFNDKSDVAGLLKLMQDMGMVYKDYQTVHIRPSADTNLIRKLCNKYDSVTSVSHGKYMEAVHQVKNHPTSSHNSVTTHAQSTQKIERFEVLRDQKVELSKATPMRMPKPRISEAHVKSLTIRDTASSKTDSKHRYNAVSEKRQIQSNFFSAVNVLIIACAAVFGYILGKL